MTEKEIKIKNDGEPAPVAWWLSLAHSTLVAGIWFPGADLHHSSVSGHAVAVAHIQKEEDGSRC